MRSIGRGRAYETTTKGLYRLYVRDVCCIRKRVRILHWEAFWW